MAEKIRLGANYRKVYAASAISNLGDGVALIGYPWLASAVTRNPGLVAGVGSRSASRGSCSPSRPASSPTGSTGARPWSPWTSCGPC